ncbi:MAG: hypothetical protein WC503_01350 [Candidatus Shapirobacteria bacterium]
MKNTIVQIAIFVVLTFLFSNTTMALVPLQPRDDIKLMITIMPTATPTPLVFKQIDPNIDFKIIPTIQIKATATPVPTIKEESDTKITPVVSPEPTVKTELSTTPVISPELTIEPTSGIIKTEEKAENKLDLKTIFMGITVGLLALIIVIQLLPKKKEGQ